MSVSVVARFSTRYLTLPCRLRVGWQPMVTWTDRRVGWQPMGTWTDRRVGWQSMGTWTDRLKRWQSGVQGRKGSTPQQPEPEGARPEGSRPEGSEEGESKAEGAEGGSKTEGGSKAEGGSKIERALKEKDEIISKKEEEIIDLKDKYLRTLAETENVRQRMSKLVEEAKLFGIQGFSKDVLEVADILEKATESVPKSELERKGANPHLLSLFEGLKITESELQKVLTKNGLKKIDPIGECFDPTFHEALFEVPGDKPGTVGVVSRVGYVLHGRTVRPARVGVVKALESTGETTS